MNNSFAAQINSAIFMTPHDLTATDPSSQISLHNSRSSAVTVFGLYVNQYAYVTPGDSCANAVTIYPSSQNTTAGAFVSPVSIAAEKSAAVGSNYLYNMIYEAIYYENIIIPSSPPGCALPGCTWGTDTIKYNWCIYLGALAPVTTTTGYTSNVPPSADSASTGSYNYNLISNYTYVGPISCSDQTLSCAVQNPQTQNIS